MEETLSSARNPLVRQLLLLQEKSSARRESGLFVVEGKREVARCARAGYRLERAFVCPEVAGRDTGLPPGVPVVRVTPALYGRVAYRGGTEGVIALARARRLRLSDLSLGENPLLVVLESVEKPGNLGAVLRSADAAGADAVLVCDPLTDLFNPNLVRSSTGAVFSVPCVACSSGECLDFLRSAGARILTAQLQDSRLYYDTPMTGATALVMGTEATGLTDIWRRAADDHIRIPMLGQADSLNVSVSAAILLYEAVRQRSAKTHINS